MAQSCSNLFDIPVVVVGEISDPLLRRCVKEFFLLPLVWAQYGTPLPYISLAITESQFFVAGQ